MEGQMPLQLTGIEPRVHFCEPDFERFAVHLPGRLLMVGHHLKIIDTACTIKTLSCSGALLKVDPSIAIPMMFFLQINGTRDEIGCAMASRTLEHIALNFNMLLSDDFLHAVLQRNAAFGATNVMPI
jgi:hypothetical protein